MWQLRKNGKAIVRTGTWEGALGEAIARGMVKMKSLRSFVLEPYSEILEEPSFDAKAEN